MPTTFFTVIFLSQYLSECDQIILMKDGQIAECGTHDQLMCKERDYANLFSSLQQEVKPSQHSTVTGSFWSISEPRKTWSRRKEMAGHAWAWLKPVWYLISLCFQIQVKETLKHKQQGAGKADNAVKVRAELDSRRGGERLKNVLMWRVT